MTILARIMGGIALVTYLIIWTPMALIALVTWNEPKTWIAWVILWVNPLSIGLVIGLLVRAQQRRRMHA